MMKYIKTSHLALLVACFFLLASCKSDRNKLEATNTETSQEVNSALGSNDSSKAISDVTPEVDSKINDEVDSTIITAQSKKEETSDTKVNKDKNESKTTPKKKKPVKVYPRKKPKITFEELTWDFGEITEGDIIDRKFKFTNTGNAPLQIIATSATCGCTRPSFPFFDIAPGKSDVIGVNYNSVGKDGEQNPEVTIESNTSPKITVIKLHGTVKPKPEKEEKIDTIISIKDSLNVKQ